MRGTAPDRMRPAHPALLLALLLPAACAQPGPTETAQLLEEVMATHQASIEGVGGRPAAAAIAAAPSSAPARQAAAPIRTPAAGPAPGAAGELVGLSPEALRQRLGEPRLRRTEGPAEVWHYQASTCHLDLVLYREAGPVPGLRVAYASARASGTARRAEAACLGDIARDASRPGAPATTEPALLGA
ncbi:hypothetical protein [Roseomonas sp. AR75]|uniref:hypothetical protein n=1 Tax=Roseomonas sp. AR75 TaxID=2562311 RepID=UPI0010C020F9|nr:hypothetical protein [Roseomonas sp. AR75]